MLGEALIDNDGVDGNAAGLGLLPLVTVFEPLKTVCRTTAKFTDAMSDSSHSPWNALAGVEVSGYEIHHGQTSQQDDLVSKGDHALAVMPQGLAWQNQEGNVLGIYLHGLFEDTKVLQALFENGDSQPVPTLDVVFDGLSEFIEKHFSPRFLDSLIR